jgi:uncharacterized protein (TIGR02302 family)
MADPQAPSDAVTRALARLKRPLALTRAGMIAERGARAFWPLLSVSSLAIAAVSFGALDIAPLTVWSLTGIGALTAAVWGWRKFGMPTKADAVARLDATLQGRPISTLTDEIALGGQDASSAALWQAHLARMAGRAMGARAPAPRANLAPRDPYALRLTALTALVMALVFGQSGRLLNSETVTPMGGAAQAAIGPSWEGWAEPPRYTGKPGLYLNALEKDDLELPEGTKFSFRFYGDPSGVTLTQTVGGTPVDPEAPTNRRDFVAETSGTITVGARTFNITLLSDDAPEVSLPSPATRRADGKLSQPFSAADDYAVTKGRAEITLDLAAMPRRYGLEIDPEARPDLVFDLPMPISGSRAEFTETLVEDAAKHPWANLPIKLVLEVEDGRGQIGRSEPQAMELPGRRFFDPLAATLIEARRDLLWSAANAKRTAQVLRTISNRGLMVIENHEIAELLPAFIDRLEAGIATGALEPALRDDLAEALWQMAEQLEDSGLADALAAMQQAQQRLSEAIRNGASKDEIAKLMAELKDATDNYMRQLAEQATPNEEGPQFGQKQESQQITSNQIQQMMDQIQKLMEEGKMAEAQEMLDQLAQLMENLQMQQGQGGEGDMPGGKSMQDLADTLRDQQQLSDDAFRELQKQFEDQPGEGQQPQNTPNGMPENGAPAEGGGAQGDTQDGTDESADQGADLAQRQRDLRRELGRQQGLLPRPGNEAGEDARKRLDDAGRAMEQAEQALRDGDAGGAISRQADAIEALREGMKSLGRALGATPPQSEGDAADKQRQGDAGGQSGNQLPRDPLGRSAGDGARIGTDQQLLGSNDAGKRAQELLEELRRRSGERLRPEDELEYFRRLLEQF